MYATPNGSVIRYSAWASFLLELILSNGPERKFVIIMRGVVEVAREQGPMLDVGDAFPSLEFATVGGNCLNIPADTMGKWTVLIFYRGDW